MGTNQIILTNDKFLNDLNECRKEAEDVIRNFDSSKCSNHACCNFDNAVIELNVSEVKELFQGGYPTTMDKIHQGNWSNLSGEYRMRALEANRRKESDYDEPPGTFDDELLPEGLWEFRFNLSHLEQCKRINYAKQLVISLAARNYNVRLHEQLD